MWLTLFSRFSVFHQIFSSAPGTTIHLDLTIICLPTTSNSIFADPSPPLISHIHTTAYFSVSSHAIPPSLVSIFIILQIGILHLLSHEAFPETPGCQWTLFSALLPHWHTPPTLSPCHRELFVLCSLVFPLFMPLKETYAELGTS